MIMGIRLSYTWTICIYYVRFLVLIVEENYKFTFTNVDTDILRLYMWFQKTIPIARVANMLSIRSRAEMFRENIRLVILHFDSFLGKMLILSLLL